MSTDKGTQQGHTPCPNLILIAKREQKGWLSRRRAARELHKIWHEHLPGLPSLESLEKTLYRHETGRVQVRDETYRKLYCLAYESTPHELFGEIAQNFDNRETYTVCSHKFIPAFVGVEAVEAIVSTGGMIYAINQWLDCHARNYDAPYGRCDLYAWPFGVLMMHLVEEITLPDLATLAVWRQQSYAENLVWATQEFQSITDTRTPKASYVLSLYRMIEPAWPSEQLDIALRVLCMPKVLLEYSIDIDNAIGHARLVERSLLDTGFDHAEMASFGIKGISTGYASWSGVVYYPVAEHRALPETDLIACELATQAVWTYCEYINREVEQGRDPIVPSEYGWRFLRAARSRLVNARPQETGQHKSMRNAILETCCIIDHLAHAIETLREIQRG